MTPRFPVTRIQINAVVVCFYGKVRQDPVLGPIFEAHVSDWTAHEAKITDFWSNAILFEHCYNGNPMQAHIAAGNVRPEHFARWLALFDGVLHQELTGNVATAWSNLAHRIGRGLSAGLVFNPGRGADVPDLRS